MLHEKTINGIKLQIEGYRDIPFQFIELENDDYKFDQIELNANDVIVDIGANVGTVCCYLAKKYPFVKIIAIEPNPVTYCYLLRNLITNRIPKSTVKPINVGISINNAPIQIYYEPDFLGSASSYIPEIAEIRKFRDVICETKTLDLIFNEENIDFCKLLKIDCEGAEFDCLLSTEILPKIEHIKAEFHLNKRLRDVGYSYDKLASHCRKYIKGSLIYVEREIPD